MRVLVVGSGGREHALTWALAASPLCEAIVCAPGNAGIAEDTACAPVAAEDVDGVVALAQRERIDLVVVGPEAPLVAGLVDRLDAAGIAAFGPSAAAARLEASKQFTKDLCQRHGIPTAAFKVFTEADAARRHVKARALPLVVKADGLAAGKGVVLAHTREEAVAAVEDALVARRFGDAGQTIVVEDCLEGEELSFFCLVDGETAVPLGSAQDHKAAYDGDKGPNTGGMGAYSPAPVLTPDLEARIMDGIIRPTVAAMRAEGCPFKGVLFAGLMIVQDKAGPKPMLLEYNVRLGDPECQVLMPRLQSDLLPALMAARDGVLKSIDLRWRPETALAVVMASAGYPGAYEKGTVIGDLSAAKAVEGVTIFHAGTGRDPDGALVATGGRVLTVTGLGKDVADAQARAYQAVELIDWPDGFYRRDIGWRALARA